MMNFFLIFHGLKLGNGVTKVRANRSGVNNCRDYFSKKFFTLRHESMTTTVLPVNDRKKVVFADRECIITKIYFS